MCISCLIYEGKNPRKEKVFCSDEKYFTHKYKQEKKSRVTVSLSIVKLGLFE